MCNTFTMQTSYRCEQRLAENSHLQKKKKSMDLKFMRLRSPILSSSIHTDFQEDTGFSQVPPDISVEGRLLIVT